MRQCFKIMIPVYNCEEWIGKNIQSIREQKYKHFQAVIINDASTDNTLKIIQKAIGDDGRFKIVNNSMRKGSLANQIENMALLFPKDEDVMMTIDGDDWLIRNDTFDCLIETYEKYDCWMTHGKVIEYGRVLRGDEDCSCRVAHALTPEYDFRVNEFMLFQLRTYKYFLRKNIKPIDLIYDLTGNYYPVAQDVAHLLPMGEMAGKERIKYIEEPYYMNNNHNPLNDLKNRWPEQRRCFYSITSKARYPRSSKEKLIKGLLKCTEWD